MATSSCPKCDKHSFELHTAEPSGSRYKLNFVQCSACGTVVGVVDYYDAGVIGKKQEKALEDLQKQLNKLQSSLSGVEHLVGRIAQNVVRR